MFFLRILLVHACYSDINDSLDNCSDAKVFDYDKTDFYCYLAKEDFTASEPNVVIQLPSGDIEVKDTDCSNSSPDPLLNNTSLDGKTLHIKGTGSTNLILKSSFTMKSTASKLVLENLILKSEVQLTQKLIESQELWLKNIEFRELNTSSILVSSKGSLKLKGVRFTGISSNENLLELGQGQDLQISELEISDSTFLALIQTEHSDVSLSTVTVTNSSVKELLLSIKEAKSSVSLSTIKLSFGNQKEDCSGLIQIEETPSSTVSIKSLEIEGSPCETQSNVRSPVLDIKYVGSVSITDSKFFSMNSSSDVGYALRAFSVESFSLSNVVFENIQNQRDSITEFKTVDSLSLTNVKVTNCLGELKGVFSANVVNLKIDNLECVSCGSNNGNGGALYYLPYSSSKYETGLTIKDSVFRDAKSELGGALFLDSGSKSLRIKLLIEDTQFYNSWAARGAVIYIGEVVSFSSGILKGLSIWNSHSEIGAPINDYHRLGKLEVRNSSISGSSGYYCGFYGEYTQSGEVLNITDSQFSNASCTKSLVRLYSWVTDVSVVLESSSMLNVSFGIELLNTKLNINNLLAEEFVQGCILAEENSSLTIENSRFSRHAKNDFGNPQTYPATTSIVVENSFLRVSKSEFKNQSGKVAGSIELSLSNATIEDSVFESGASREGGAIRAEDGSLKVYGTQFKNLESGKGGAIYISGSETTLQSSTFSQTHASDSGGAVISYSPSELFIENCTFSEASSTQGGAVYVIRFFESLKTFTIKDSRFFNNSAEKGGSLYASNSVLNVTNSYFQNNSAETGGAVSIKHIDYNYYPSYISNCSFVNNSATRGGAINWENVRPELNSNYYLNNSAVYGDQVASYAVAMQVISQRRQLLVIEAAPGQAVDSSLEVALIDHYGSIVTDDNSSKASMTGSNASVSGKTEIQAEKGVFTFNDFKLLGSTNQNVTISIYSSTIKTNQENTKNDSAAFSSALELTVYLRKCQKGEYDTGKECKVCGEDQYSLSPDKSCASCPPQARCLGNWTMFPKPGYWRAFNDTDKFYECPNPDACIGSPENSNYLGNCSEGYRGHMCQACERGYFKTFESTCTVCPNPTLNILRLIGMIAFMGGYNIFLVMTTLKAAYEPESLSSIYMKIFTNYTQLAYLTTKFKLRWPKVVLELFSIQKTTLSLPEQLFSVECYLQNSGDSFENAVLFKALIMSLLPLSLCVATLLVWGVISIKKGSSEPMKKQLVATLIILFFTVHPIIINSLFSVFSCREIEGLGMWLIQDLEVECWDSTHTLYSMGVALPGIIVWGVATPAFIVWIMQKRRKYLHRLENKLRFGFVFNGYRVDRFYWEFLIMYREVVLIALSVFFSRVSVMIQTLTCLAVLSLFCYFHVREKPFIESHLNDMETRSLITATVTVYFGLYYFSEDLDDISEFILFMVICLSNAWFLVYWLWYFLKAELISLVNKFPSIKQRVFKSDGFDSEMYTDNSYRRGKITVDGVTLYTMLSRETPEEDPLPGIYTMLDLYREAFKYIDDEPEDFKEQEIEEEDKYPEEECIEALQITDL